MMFRVLKFEPGRRAGRPATRVDPVARPCARWSTEDTAYFWEGTPPASSGSSAATRAARCGTRPGPAVPVVPAIDRGHVVASGTGTVDSYVVHHAPQVPGKKLPLVLAVVELDEGVRMIGELRGVAPDDGRDRRSPVHVDLDGIDDELTSGVAASRAPRRP